MFHVEQLRMEIEVKKQISDCVSFISERPMFHVKHQPLFFY